MKTEISLKTAIIWMTIYFLALTAVSSIVMAIYMLFAVGTSNV